MTELPTQVGSRHLLSLWGCNCGGSGFPLWDKLLGLRGSAEQGKVEGAELFELLCGRDPRASQDK